ncbi:hypothetical protein [Streptomyces yunnanensis]|uniref:Uncharacterized protein n=1 Tax=Streptomyces noursei TaxID=1971 RepID=A0A2N8PAY8_STRNR|nr:hypothetical protein [Streptomyces yunnanensis]PNE38181.1 hypothetical protein AOB60_29275 [Streptomyces noursei]
MGDQVLFGKVDRLCSVGGLGQGGELWRQSGQQAVGEGVGDDGFGVRRVGALAFCGGEDAGQ